MTYEPFEGFEDPESVLESVIVEMKNAFRGTGEIGVDGTHKAEREDLAREDLEKRNEYRRLADQYKTQWEDQKQIEDLKPSSAENDGSEKTAAVAKHRNIDAEAHLREMLTEIQNSKTFGTLAKMDQDATEAAILAKTAVEVDVAYQDAKLEREFSSYAEEASLDKELAELKAKLQ